MSDARRKVTEAVEGRRIVTQADASEILAELDSLEEALAAAHTAGSELATALWALRLAQEPMMADGLDRAIRHAEEVVKKYTSDASRAQLSGVLERAKTGVVQA